MKFKLIASTIALIAIANLGNAQDTKPKKINPSKPALHRAPPPPKFIAPVIVPDEPAGIKTKHKTLAPPPPPPPVKVRKVSFKAPPPPPAKQKN